MLLAAISYLQECHLRWFRWKDLRRKNQVVTGDEIFLLKFGAKQEALILIQSQQLTLTHYFNSSHAGN